MRTKVISKGFEQGQGVALGEHYKELGDTTTAARGRANHQIIGAA